MKRRLTTCVLAAFYLLQATWLLHAGMDLLLPTMRQAVASAKDSCCNSGCGCPEEAKVNRSCCCSKTAADAPVQAPKTPSFIEAARCKGVEAAMTQAFTQPVVCAFVTVPPAQPDAAPFSTPDAKPFIPPTVLVLDKVPIA